LFSVDYLLVGRTRGDDEVDLAPVTRVQGNATSA